MEYVGELPPGDWKFRVFGAFIVAVCPDHQPIIIKKDGTIELLMGG